MSAYCAIYLLIAKRILSTKATELELLIVNMKNIRILDTNSKRIRHWPCTIHHASHYTTSLVFYPLAFPDVLCWTLFQNFSLWTSRPPSNLSSLRDLSYFIPYGERNKDDKRERGCWWRYNKLVRGFPRTNLQSPTVAIAGIIVQRNVFKNYRFCFLTRSRQKFAKLANVATLEAVLRCFFISFKYFCLCFKTFCFY